MKYLVLLLILVSIFSGNSNSQPIQVPDNNERILSQQIPTNLNYPEPKNVLVVYKIPSNQSDDIGIISEQVKDYYVGKYNIPSQNIVGLSLPSSIFYEGHSVILYREGEVIKDATSADSDIPDTHAWQYYIDYIQEPLKNHLDNTIVGGEQLKNIIRYIVLCYGMPFKIQARYDWSSSNELWRENIAMDGLLTILYYPNILELWHKYYGDDKYGNPYWQADNDYNFDMRFKPNHFINSQGTVLNYLVSRFDALDYETIEGMIDKSTTTDFSGEKTWILDAGGASTTDLRNANTALTNFDFSTYFDQSISTWKTTNSNHVIAYSSDGTHAGMPSDYIQNTLNFNYSNGSVFNTYESFNGESIRTLTRRAGQGLLTEFFLTGGTSGAGHTWEPTTTTIIDDEFWFPGYAMGYSSIDAAYRGMPYLAFQNVVVGDPLSAIALGKQTLNANTTWSGTNLVTGQITVPTGKTLTVASNAVINFKYQGALQVDGNLHILPGATLNFINGSSFVLNGSLNTESNITIPSGASLTVNSGSSLNFTSGITLTLNGTLNANKNITIPAGVYFNIKFRSQFII